MKCEALIMTRVSLFERDSRGGEKTEVFGSQTFSLHPFRLPNLLENRVGERLTDECVGNLSP